MKKIAIFDLDGTLSDSIESMKYCADRALAPLGYGPFSRKDYQYFVGDGAEKLIRRALGASGDEKQVHFEEAMQRYREYFAVDCMYQVKPYEGIPELLAALKEKELRLAVLSNKPHEQTVMVVETLFGKGYFDWIQGQKPGIPLKPDPAGVYGILDAFSFQPSETVYLGDTATDMKTGKNAGAFTVGVLWGFREREELEEAKADALIKSPSELLKFL